MGTSIWDEGKKFFSDTIELQQRENNTMIDCQVKDSNTFAKILSESEIAIFGDYDIFILYKYDSYKRESNYEVKTEKRNFCKIISYEAIAKEYKVFNEITKVTARILFQPSCKFSMKKKPRHNTLWQIEVYGEIKISFILNETNILETNKKQINQEHSKKENSKSQIWKFENNGRFSIQELMEMDLESLKKIKKMD